MGNKQDMNASKQTLKDKLMAIILLETSKPHKEMDSDLVTECVDFLMELEGKERLTKEEIQQRVNAIPFIGKVTAIGLYAKKKMRAKRLVVIAAVLAVIFALFTILTFAMGSSDLDLLEQLGYAIAEMFNGETVDEGGVTIYSPYKTKEYDSIEALLTEEKIDVLYPTWLPNNEEIVSVTYLLDAQSERYILKCSDVKFNIVVKTNSSLSEEEKSGCIEEETGGISFYYFVEGDIAQAMLEYNNMVYSVKSDTKDNLFKIIENLREII